MCGSINADLFNALTVFVILMLSGLLLSFLYTTMIFSQEAVGHALKPWVRYKMKWPAAPVSAHSPVDRQPTRNSLSMFYWLQY